MSLCSIFAPCLPHFKPRIFQTVFLRSPQHCSQFRPPGSKFWIRPSPSARRSIFQPFFNSFVYLLCLALREAAVSRVKLTSDRAGYRIVRRARACSRQSNRVQELPGKRKRTAVEVQGSAVKACHHGSVLFGVADI